MKRFVLFAALFVAVAATVAWGTKGKFTTSHGALVANSGEAMFALAQPATLQNSESVSGSNAAVTKSIAAVAEQSVQVYAITSRCSAGTAGLTVKDGVAGTTIWTTAAAASASLTFFTPLATTAGNGMDVTLATCGAGNVGTLDVQASQF